MAQRLLWPHQNLVRVSAVLASFMLHACRTDPAVQASPVMSLKDVPTAGDCAAGPETVPCKTFDQGNGGETAEPIPVAGVQAVWAGDLAQLYEYYEQQLGREFESDHVFAGLSFEDVVVLAVADEQLAHGGRKVVITKIERDDDEFTLYVERWQPKKKGSGCKFFSHAISRPYHMVKISKAELGQGDQRPKITVVPTTKYFKCPEGTVLE